MKDHWRGHVFHSHQLRSLSVIFLVVFNAVLFAIIQISLQRVREPVSLFPSNIILVHDNEHDPNQVPAQAGQTKASGGEPEAVGSLSNSATARGSSRIQWAASSKGRMAVCVKPIHYDYDQVSNLLPL